MTNQREDTGRFRRPTPAERLLGEIQGNQPDPKAGARVEGPVAHRKRLAERLRADRGYDPVEPRPEPATSKSFDEVLREAAQRRNAVTRTIKEKFEGRNPL